MSSNTTDILDVVSLANFLQDKNSSASLEDCHKLTEFLKRTSCLIVRDPRVTEADNENFLNMMEKYYDQPHDVKVMLNLFYPHYRFSTFLQLIFISFIIIDSINLKNEKTPLSIIPNLG